MLDHPQVGHIQDLIEIEEADDFNAVFPKHRIASVELTLKDGRVLMSEPTEALGDPENPISEAGINEKFSAFTRPVLGDEEADSLLTMITGLNGGNSAQALSSALARHYN